MKKKEVENLVYVPAFKTKEVPGVTFGGFSLDRHMASENKMPLRRKTLPEAMISCADKGKGWHLITAYQWASMAHFWKKAKSLDELDFDPHAETWQWVMGLFMEDDGHVDVLGSLDVSYTGSPYGRGTISGSGNSPILAVDGAGINWLKKWETGAFRGMMAYIAEANSARGGLYHIVDSKKDSLQLQIASSPGNGPATFCIVNHVPIDMTKGMNTGDHITALSNDNDLKPFAIPGKTRRDEDPLFGNDHYWFYKSRIMRAAFRDGAFDDEADAGVFALYLNTAPSNSVCGVGFRAGKAIRNLVFLKICFDIMALGRRSMA